MALVQFEPEEMAKPLFSFFNVAGTWGPGGDIEAECIITDYQFPAVENPTFDRENKKGLTYAFFNIRCIRPGEQNINEGWWLEQNRAFQVLQRIGVHVNEEDGSHDTDDVTGLRVIVEAGNPGKNKENPPVEAYSKIKTLHSVG